MTIRRFIIGGVLLLYFCSLLWLVAGLPIIFNSPDEAANYAFADEFSQHADLALEEPDNMAVGGVIHPRSMVAIGDRLVPRSFLGLPVLAGSFGAIFGSAGILIVTPVLAVLCVLAWRSVVYRLFEDARLADLSAALFAIHPAFWYYSGRTMMHNVGFVAFLVFAVWFLIVSPPFQGGVRGGSERVRVPRSEPPLAPPWKGGGLLLSGACLALALAFRTNEAVWVIPATAWIFWMMRKTISLKTLGLFLVGFVLVAAPFAWLNQDLYGSIFITGYQATDTSNVPIADAVVASEQPEASLVKKISSTLLPFGIAEKATARHVWQYGIALYPWMTAVAVIGFVMVLARSRTLANKQLWLGFASLAVAVSVWLFVMYGSWTFHDNPDPNIFSLGNSYVRYWIPIFLLSTPFGAFAIQKIKKPWLQLFVLCVFGALSLNLILFGDDGFVQTRKNLMTFEQKRDRIFDLTEQDAIVIADRSDKFVFPERRVVTPLRSDAAYAAIPALLETAPLYYFGITLPQEDIDHLNAVLLQGATIVPVETIFDETLYRINRTP